MCGWVIDFGNLTDHLHLEPPSISFITKHLLVTVPNAQCVLILAQKD